MKRLLLLLSLIVALGAFPALAQESVTHAVTFDGFSFNFPDSLATNVNITQYAGDPTTVEQPGGPEVRHTQFDLYNGSIAQGTYGSAGTVNVYRLADFAGYDLAQQQVNLLQSLLTQRPDLAQYMMADMTSEASNLPFLPVAPGSQVIRARASYVDTSSFQGVSYITLYRLDVAPIIGSEFRYTFQGISSDGTAYVAANFALNTGLFPAEVGQDFDLDAFSEQFEGYLNESMGTLNNATPEDFAPSLTALDALIQSFSFAAGNAPNVPPTPIPQVTLTPTPSSMGGLAGRVWQLVSYGNPDELQPALENVPVTLEFDEAGVAGSAGCNSYSGDFQFDNTTIIIGTIVSTMMACEEPVMEQENAYLSSLQSATSYQIDGSQLQLTYDGGVLNFTAP